MAPADQNIFDRAVAALKIGALEEAERTFAKFLRRNSRHFGALNLLGMLLIRQARYSEAETILRRAIRVDGRSEATHYNHGIVLKALNRPNDAFVAFGRAIAINPSVPESWNNQGTVLNDLMRYDEAIGNFQKAIALRPDYAEAFYNIGQSFFARGRHDQALESYDTALQLRPDFAEAFANRGNVLSHLRRPEEALASYERALEIKPEMKYVLGHRLHTKMFMCDWRHFDTECAMLISAVKAEHYVATPFEIVSVSSTASDQLKCAQIFIRNTIPASTKRLSERKRHRQGRIRLAYVSADFREHPVAHLAAGLFQHHDRVQFEVIAISLNPTDGSKMRVRLEGAFEKFIDVSSKDDQEVARLMRDLDVDIAIDLMGFTGGSRPAIFALRPCPIQVSYLGFSATMGADFIDYIIADPVVIPADQRAHFSEQTISLPDTYFVYDSKQNVSEQTPTRVGQGLPETGFVFCAYNNSYKITPHMFGIWMRLLQAVEGSVLWLSGMHASAVRNLRLEAEVRGVAGARLIFSKRLERIEDHLARFRLADLFLDTLPYNAHTTASDALWTGLPVLTCRGVTFAGRVAASLLNAVGLSELVTDNLADYEALAFKLAREPALLAEIRAKLARNRVNYPLFRHIEAAYTTMWEICQRGEAPKCFSVKPITMTTQ